MRKDRQRPEELEFDANNPDKFKDENMYKYHENTQPFDPTAQPFSYFYCTFAGQIEFGEFESLDGLAIKYQFMAGNDWQLASHPDCRKGAGQHSFKGVTCQNSSQRVVWNLPFEITYRSMNPYGWPQLVLYATEINSEGEEIVRAYGCTHMPIEPGTHKK